jgi:hypothetical protein
VAFALAIIRYIMSLSLTTFEKIFFNIVEIALLGNWTTMFKLETVEGSTEKVNKADINWVEMEENQL